jgi:GT2 family glycosyltransferase
MRKACSKYGIGLSVIVPCFNCAESLGCCLDALLEHSQLLPDEVIVVNDASTDRSMEAAIRPGVKLVTSNTTAGPGASRNLGAAHASGKILVFVDADVAVAPNALGKLGRHFTGDPDCTAVIGSYDSTPKAGNLISEYRNLLHCYVHQHAPEQVSHFWTGLGAIRMSAFKAVGGFDETEFGHALEDVELGYRLCDVGYRIELDRAVQGKHLKHWSLGSMARTDLFVRAIPWTHLILARKKIPRDLSLSWKQRLSVVLAWLSLLTLLVAPVEPLALTVQALALIVFLLVNLDFFRFLQVLRGWALALAAFPLHWFYHFNSGAGFLIGVIFFKWPGLKNHFRFGGIVPVKTVGPETTDHG